MLPVDLSKDSLCCRDNFFSSALLERGQFNKGFIYFPACVMRLQCSLNSCLKSGEALLSFFLSSSCKLCLKKVSFLCPDAYIMLLL